MLDDSFINSKRRQIDVLQEKIERLYKTNDIANISNYDFSSPERQALDDVLKDISETRKEIEKLQREIDNYQNGMEERKENAKEEERQKEEYQQRKTVENKGHEELSEDIRQHTFDLLRKKYKSHSIWDRVVARVNGKTPNWKKIAGYSQQELDHLINVSDGDTYYQMRNDTSIRKSNDSKDEEHRKTDSEMMKQESARHWNQFLSELNSGTQLRKSMEYEQKHGGRI